MFVDPVRAKDYECAFCLSVYKDPVQIGCQDHIFCKECIDQLISMNGPSFSCPLCKAECTSDDVTRVKFIARQIGCLKVKCPNATANQQFIETQNTNENGLRRSTRLKQKIDTQIGQKRKRSFNNQDADTDNISQNKRRKLIENESCEWQGEYSDLNKHIKKCPLQLISCEYCSNSMLRRELEEHHNECLKFPLTCAQCNRKPIQRDLMTLHISTFCPMTLMHCDECKQELKRKDKKLHLEKECPESLINCVFYKFGCKDKLKRKDVTKHIQNSAFTHNHLVQIANHHIILDNTVNELKNEITSLKKRINVLETKQIQWENVAPRHSDINWLSNVPMSHNDDGQCVICLEVPPEEPLQTQCNHIFCGECILMHLQEIGTCPICRTKCDINKLKTPLTATKTNINNYNNDNNTIFFNINYPPPRHDKKLKIKMRKDQTFGTIIGPLQTKFNKQITFKFEGESIRNEYTPHWLINEFDAEDGDFLDANYT